MKVRRGFEKIEPVAKDLLAGFQTQNLICEVGGSFRRRAQMIGDLDIVVQADSLLDIYLPDIYFERLGDQASHGTISLDGEPFGIDIWCATPRQWGAFLWYITGSKELNVIMRQKAKAQGLKLSQFGLFDKGVQIDDGSERGVSDALGMNWIEPVARQKFVKTAADQVFQIASSSGDKFYTVSLTGSEWSCSCPHNTFRKVECKHIKEVRKVKTLAA